MATPKPVQTLGSRGTSPSWTDTVSRILNPRRAVGESSFDPRLLAVGPLVVLAAVYAIALAITRFAA